jgi:hypothetical protein
MQKCPRCETSAKLRPRDFSDQAVATLVTHGDLDKKIVGASVCDDCYHDLRDAMIEHVRAAELKQSNTSKTGAGKNRQAS